MARDFSGAVADAYVRFRRGYPEPVIDAIVEQFGLGADDLAVDLGCGSGQLTLPLEARVGVVLGIDPEPDMLRHARISASERGITNASFLIGADRDVAALVGERSIGALTVAVAIHWMDRDQLFRDVRPLLRPGGGIAVVTNGAPLWLQDADWSRALRACLETWTGERQ
ncbi:MAG TPA: class I SAM-dependent methyltransferase, partial [Micromonosporaceae bacterium]